jgi:hypothetical protein
VSIKIITRKKTGAKNKHLQVMYVRKFSSVFIPFANVSREFACLHLITKLNNRTILFMIIHIPVCMDTKGCDIVKRGLEVNLPGE